MRNVAAFLYEQLLLWCGSPIFQVAPVGGFVATHAVWVSPRNCQEVTKKPWRVEPPTIGLSLGYLAGNMPDAADAHNPCIGQDNGCPHPGSLGHSHGKVAEKWGQEATARETHIHHIINDVH